MKKENLSDSDEKIRMLNERYAELQVEIARLNKENAELRKETDRQLKENARQIKETKEMIKENGKQIGGLGNKFGGYTEAMARPSIRRMLEERFDADFQGSIRLIDTRDALDLEVDAWGVSRNGAGAAYIVETKSKFRDKHIEQVWKLVERFRIYHFDYWNLAVYPMLAVVEISEAGRRKVWDAGIHLVEINDGVFRYAEPPEGFEANGYHGAHGVRRDVPHLRVVIGGNRKHLGAG